MLCSLASFQVPIPNIHRSSTKDHRRPLCSLRPMALYQVLETTLDGGLIKRNIPAGILLEPVDGVPLEIIANCKSAFLVVCTTFTNALSIHDYSAIKPKDNTSSVIPHHTDVEEERYTSGGFHIDVSNEHVGLNGQGYQYASGPISCWFLLLHSSTPNIPYAVSKTDPCHPTVSGVCWPMQPHVPHPGLPYTLYAPAFPGGTSPQNNHAPFPSTTDAPHLPVGTCQVGGTTYFPVARPPLFGFDRAVPPPDHNSYSWRNFYQATGDVYGQPSSHIGTAFSTHRPLVETSPNQHASNAATTQVPEVDSTRTHTDESEFPYRPPKNQRVGHVRRISVAIKTDSFNQ